MIAARGLALAVAFALALAQESAPSRAERLEHWRDLLATGAVTEIVEEGPPLVARGGGLAGDVEATALVARALHDAGEPGAARALLAALRLEASDPRIAHVALARAAMALAEDRLDAVRAELEVDPGSESGPAAVRYPEEPVAWLLVGRAHARAGALARADAYLERFVALTPLHPEAPSALHLLARHALARREIERARALREEAEKRARWHEILRARTAAKRAHPDAPEPRLALAELWRAVGHLDRARSELEALLALHPAHSEALARLADLEKR